MKKFSILCVFIFFALYSAAQQSELFVKVTGTNGKPVAGAKVNISNYSALTDSTGQLSFQGKAHTNYLISIHKTGFQDYSGTVSFRDGQQKLTVMLFESSYQLKEVLIQDNHLEIRRQNESLTLETVDENFIQRHLGGSLMKTLERLPGIKTIGIGSGQSKPLIRGLGFNRVIVLDKGIKHEGQQWGADHGLELDQFATSEVELIKGAASFMYGADAIAGAINVKPSKPPLKHTIGGSADLIAKSNNNLYGTSVNLNGRTDQLFFDARFTYQRYGDYRVPTDKVYVYDFEVPVIDNYLRNTAGNETALHFTAGRLGQKFSSIFYVSNVYSKSGFFANAHGLEPRNVDNQLHDRYHRDIQMPSQQVNHFKIVNKTDYLLANHRLELELGIQRNFRQEFSQYVNHGYMPAVYPIGLPIPQNLEREFDKTAYAANLRDKLTLGRHTFTVGINSEFQDNTINGWTFLVPSFKQFIGGAFMYDQFRLNEKLILHGALRYDYGQIRINRYLDWFGSTVQSGSNPISEKLVRAEHLDRKFNSLVWSAGINYNLEKFEFKANIGKSFRMPIAKELGANGVNYHYFSYEKGDPSLSPEQSYQADASFGWKEKRWSVTLSPFYNYFPNYIYLNPTSNYDYFYGAGNQVFNYAQSNVMRYGGEIQFKYNFSKHFASEILGEYLYAEQLSGAKKGYTLPFSPPPSLLLNLTYTPSATRLFKDTYLSIDCRITAKQHHIVPPEKSTSGYHIFNIQAGTKFSLYEQPIMVSLQAQNVLNTKYLNHTSFYRLIELPEAGRNVVLSVKIPFMIKAGQTKQSSSKTIYN